MAEFVSNVDFSNDNREIETLPSIEALENSYTFLLYLASPDILHTYINPNLLSSNESSARVSHKILKYGTDTHSGFERIWRRYPGVEKFEHLLTDDPHGLRKSTLIPVTYNGRDVGPVKTQLHLQTAVIPIIPKKNSSLAFKYGLSFLEAANREARYVQDLEHEGGISDAMTSARFALIANFREASVSASFSDQTKAWSESRYIRNRRTVYIELNSYETAYSILNDLLNDQTPYTFEKLSEFVARKIEFDLPKLYTPYEPLPVLSENGNVPKISFVSLACELGFDPHVYKDLAIQIFNLPEDISEEKLDELAHWIVTASSEMK